MPELQIWFVFVFAVVREYNYNFFLKIDGYLARRFNMRSVLGTILDPAADKILMTTLVVTLTMKGLLPCTFVYSLWCIDWPLRPV
jgi:phosphatidylglycerophosphate synthase